MKKIKFLILMVTLFLFGLSASANATLFNKEHFDDGDFYDEYYGTWSEVNGYYGFVNDDEWSGFYLGNFAGPANRDIMVALAEEYLESTDHEFSWAKTGYNKRTGEFVYEGDFTITVEFTEGTMSGTWELESPYELGFYAVKGGQEFALYFVYPYTNEGIWTTKHLTVGQNETPGLSHLSALAKEGTPVPEPGMVILLGIGLIGLAFYSRRRLFN